MKKSIFYFFIDLMLSACGSVVEMTSSKMNRLELGMSKEEVTHILGNGYTIAEKRIEAGKQMEILSYRDFYKDEEFYMFVFEDNRLKEWYRDLLPKVEK